MHIGNSLPKLISLVFSFSNWHHMTGVGSSCSLNRILYYQKDIISCNVFMQSYFRLMKSSSCYQSIPKCELTSATSRLLFFNSFITVSLYTALSFTQASMETNKPGFALFRNFKVLKNESILGMETNT